jgi:hypothetical protein
MGVIIVAENGDGKIVGMLAGMLTPLWCAPNIVVAAEMAWYMHPDHRTGTNAVRMLREFEAWGDKMGAAKTVVSSIPDLSRRVGPLYEKLGYHKIEDSYVR